MTRFRWYLLLLVCTPMIHAADPEPISRIGFGSCVHQDKRQNIWDRVIDAKPQIFLMLGDNMYADYPKSTPIDEAYKKMNAVPGFKKLRESCPFLGTWDDHDYGLNDAGVEFPDKKRSLQLFLDFFNVPADSPRRTREGVYHAEIHGPPGKRIQFILLDGRYHRSPLKKGPRGSVTGFPRIVPYIANNDPAATFLGAEQWRWLEEQLKQPAEIRLIGSGIQVVSEDHPFEKWMNIPHERDKLYSLLRSTKAEGVVILSGDRHMADLSVMDAGIGYPLYDLTASGFNQASDTYRDPEKNRHRVATLSWGQHFGFIEVDWTAKDPLIRLQIREEDGQIAFQHKVPLSALQPQQTVVEKPVGPGAVSTAAAARRVGEKLTVEMTVNATGGNAKKRFFLNSEKNFRDEKNFTIVLEMGMSAAKFAESKIDDPAKHYAGKRIRVTGTVAKYMERAEIIVTDPAQIQIVE